MSIVKWHEQLSIKIRCNILIFIVLIILDNSTLFDIKITETLVSSSNLSTWVSALLIGNGFVDGFSFQLVSIYLLIVFLLFGAIKSPFRNIWALEFSIISTAFVIIFSNYQILDVNNSFPVLLNMLLQSLKLIPLLLAYRWTRQLATPVFI